MNNRKQNSTAAKQVESGNAAAAAAVVANAADSTAAKPVDSGNAADPVPTKATKRKKVFRNEDIDFPIFSDNPDEWRTHPRTPIRMPFYPDAPPRTLGPGFSGYDAAGTTYCKLLADAPPILYEETNRYGGHRCSTGKIVSYRWEHMDLSEFFAFLGLYLAMGICRKRDYQLMWTEKGVNATPGYAKHMSLRRFKQIKQNMHFEDNEQAVLQGWNDKTSGSHDYIYKIHRFWDAAFQKYRIARAPSKHLAFDEFMVLFTGHFKFKVRIKSKPIPKGMKLYYLTDEFGYALAALLHAGDYGQDDELKTFDKVWEGLDQTQLFDQGFHLYMDNYYTSLKLVSELYDREIYVAGMLKSTMAAGCPPVLTDCYCAISQRMQRGQAMFLHTDRLSICNWKDSANAIMLYSLPEVVEQWMNCNRRVKTSEGTQTIQPVPQPVVYEMYNKYMGGVDVHGQRIESSHRHFKSRKWFMSLGDHVLSSAATNTYIILKEVILPGSSTRLTTHRVRLLIAQDLLKVAEQLRQLPNQISPSKPSQTSAPAEINHLPRKRPKRGLCKAHIQATWTHMECETCKIPLCLNCYAPFHTIPNFKFDDAKKRKAGIGERYGAASRKQHQQI